jgi:hypothetical protein
MGMRNKKMRKAYTHAGREKLAERFSGRAANGPAGYLLVAS